MTAVPLERGDGLLLDQLRENNAVPGWGVAGNGRLERQVETSADEAELDLPLEVGEQSWWSYSALAAG